MAFSDSALFLLRLGSEVTTKSRRVRMRFQRQLKKNLEEALAAVGVKHIVRNEWSRLFVETKTADADDALDAIKRVFGVHSISPVRRRCKPTLEEIVRVGEETFADDVRGKKFAVRARRSGEFPFHSMDIHIELGKALNQYADVDLSNPDVTVYVEVRSETVYLFSEHIPAAGGLPIGTQGRAVALISGGFDSAVAAWLMLKRGVQLDYVLCNLAGVAFERNVLSVVKILADSWSYGSVPIFYVVDFEKLVVALKRNVDPKYIQVVLKRLMYRTGERIAEQVGAEAVITGEAIGQVSSQTLANLRAIDDVARLPVLRPLLCMDKQEIIDRTRLIGTYDTSSKIQEYCALVSDKPVTAAKTDAVRSEESRLDLGLLDAAISNRRMIDVTALDADELILPYLNISEVPEGAVVVDCRERSHYAAWHYPDAIHFESDDLLERFSTLDKSKTYVIYCPIGLQSSVAAEKMQSAGYDAYNFKGGSRALREYAQEQGVDF